MPTTLRAFTSSPRRRSLTSALNCFARLARTAAGRACRPDAFEMTSGPELTDVASAVMDRHTCAASHRPSQRDVRIVSAPAVTGPDAAAIARDSLQST